MSQVSYDPNGVPYTTNTNGQYVDPATGRVMYPIPGAYDPSGIRPPVFPTNPYVPTIGSGYLGHYPGNRFDPGFGTSNDHVVMPTTSEFDLAQPPQGGAANQGGNTNGVASFTGVAKGQAFSVAAPVTDPNKPLAPVISGQHYDYWDQELGVDLSHAPILEGVTPSDQTGFDINKKSYKYDKNGKVVGVNKGPAAVYDNSGGIPKFADVSSYMNQVMKWAASDPQGQFQSLQLELYQAGFYTGAGKPLPGSYTGVDKRALTNALKDYTDIVKSDPNNPNLLTFSEYLGTAARAAKIFGGGGGGGGGGGYTRAPLSLTDPAELRQTLQQAAGSALGRQLSKSELAHFVSAFHGAEKGAYDRAGAGHTYTNPNPSGRAIEYVDNHHQGEEQGRLSATYMDALNSLLGVK